MTTRQTTKLTKLCEDRFCTNGLCATCVRERAAADAPALTAAEADAAYYAAMDPVSITPRTPQPAQRTGPVERIHRLFESQ